MRILAILVTHDSSVCSINDGKIEFYCKEERLSRVKRDKHPFKSLELYKKLNYGKVDHVIWMTPSNCEPEKEFIYQVFLEKFFDAPYENYSIMNHHNCHAGISFYNSGFSESLVFVIDRNGSLLPMGNTIVARESESVYHCTYPDNIKPIYKSFISNRGYENYISEYAKNLYDFFPNTDIRFTQGNGIVKVYEAATTLIGQNTLENGKTMGLSSYGKDLKYEKLFLDNGPINNYFSTIFDSETSDEKTCFVGLEDKITKNITEDNFQFYANKAKHVQLETQKEVLKLIKKYVELTNIKNVCIVGGYGLNVVANNYYIKNLPDVNFYFEPLSDDSGISIGGALLKYRQLTKDMNIYTPRDNFYHYYEPEPLIQCGQSATLDDVCDLLSQQKSVAIFQGNPEAGPRALGHRSILFDARNTNCKSLVNKIKNREWYRPFAGIILESEFENYFETLGQKESKYMTVNFVCKEHTKKLVPGIIHVDNTCRIQTVKEGFLFDLLTKFNEKTGCPMMLNTSFNSAGEPLIQTKAQALHMLNTSDLDAVYFVEDDKLVFNGKYINQQS